MTISKDSFKALVGCCSTVEKADFYINRYYGFATTAEKIAFLKGMYDVSSPWHENATDEFTYHAMLDAIINSKW